jgi:hypothetical protein
LVVETAENHWVAVTDKLDHIMLYWAQLDMNGGSNSQLQQW